MPKNRQLAFLFEEANGLPKEVLGGKGAGLVEMVALGLPVPPGAVVSTSASRAYWQEGVMPSRLDWQTKRVVGLIERRIGRGFGSQELPLLLSVRSGALVSMPGMMDTLLNVGLNRGSLAGLGKVGGKRFAADTFERFQTSFLRIVGRPAPEDPQVQLRLAMEAVCRSWNSERARAYRRENQIADDLGTAIVLQAMVFGNLDDQSGTGVVFSRNVTTGEKVLYGEFLPRAQGEDVVSGRVTPLPVSALAEANPTVYEELLGHTRFLERRLRGVVDVEYTVEGGRLWMLQFRPAKQTSLAQVRFLVSAVEDGIISRKEAVAGVRISDIHRLAQPVFDPSALANARVLGKGTPASPGVITGRAVFSVEEAITANRQGVTPILFRPETRPASGCRRD